jgi:hypothetical protein
VFEKFFSRKQAALTGAPPVRRMKSYSAQSGYVYQYYYEGQRPFRAGTEFVFSVSADRKSWQPTAVLVGEAPVAVWEAAHARALSANERYAIAKMALFRAFDERPSPAMMKDAIELRDHDVEAIVETLGL